VFFPNTTEIKAQPRALSFFRKKKYLNKEPKETIKSETKISISVTSSSIL
jgi:hypothetical protein